MRSEWSSHFCGTTHFMAVWVDTRVVFVAGRTDEGSRGPGLGSSLFLQDPLSGGMLYSSCFSRYDAVVC